MNPAAMNQDDRVRELAALVRTELDRGDTAALHQAGRVRLLATADTVRRAPGAPRGVWVLAAAATVALLITAGVRLWPRPLRYEVEGAQANGSFLSAPASHGLAVKFSDGSRIDAQALAQLRVDEVAPEGARVHLERGTLHVHAVHRVDSAWRFLAGPYEVVVTGTKFDLAWDPVSEVVSLDLVEGSVNVRSPLSDYPISVRAGQHFTSDRRRSSFSMTEPGASAVVEPTPQPTAGTQENPAPQATAKPEPSAEKPHDPGAQAKPPESWPRLIAAGRFDDVLEQAGSQGIAETLSSRSSQDLRALSDAARFRGRGDLAERSLLAIRQRFASTNEGRTAAFYLARMYEGRSSLSSAERWYETYRSEAPSGQYAAEALAGLMRVVKAARGERAARPLAEQYLKSYPQGVEAKTAHRILGDG